MDKRDMYGLEELNIEQYDVQRIITRPDGGIEVSYSVTPHDACPQTARVVRTERPHPDFLAAFLPMSDMFKKFLEIRLPDDVLVTVRKVTFLESSSYGRGVVPKSCTFRQRPKERL